MSDITLLLRQIEAGDPGAAERLLQLVYDDLKRLAAARMGSSAGSHTLQPTALVHDAWARLGGDHQPAWRNRAHFFAAAAEAMRWILINQARRRSAQRHGGGQQRIDIAAIEVPAPVVDDDRLLALNDALEKFAAADPKKAELVKLRYFVGFTLEEAADALAIPHGTAKRWWTFARAWLVREMGA